MAFIVIAPGLRDVVASAAAFRAQPLEQTQRSERTRRTPGTEEEHLPTEQEMLSQSQRGERAREHYEETEELPHQRAPVMVAEQIMTTPVETLGPGAPIMEAWRLFQERQFHHIPVIGGNDRIVGIVSELDLLRDVAGIGRAARRRHNTIQPLMIPRVITATANTEIREIARIFYDQHIGALPIVNAVDYPIGIVTRSDILRALVKKAPLEMWV
ncbi:HPP family protein [Pseudomonadota bacterium]